MRYWHPHGSEKNLIEDWDAFWTEARSDKGHRGFAVVIADPEFGDRTACLVREMEEAQGIAMALNKAREYDKIIAALKTCCPDYLEEFLEFAMEERP